MIQGPRHDARTYHLAMLEEQPEPLQDQVLNWASPTHAVWGGFALPTKFASLFQKQVTEGSLYVHLLSGACARISIGSTVKTRNRYLNGGAHTIA